jgi:hypothetical protein
MTLQQPSRPGRLVMKMDVDGQPLEVESPPDSLLLELALYLEHVARELRTSASGRIVGYWEFTRLKFGSELRFIRFTYKPQLMDQMRLILVFCSCRETAITEILPFPDISPKWWAGLCLDCLTVYWCVYPQSSRPSPRKRAARVAK